jgi:hypothetical protein
MILAKNTLSVFSSFFALTVLASSFFLNFPLLLVDACSGVFPKPGHYTPTLPAGPPCGGFGKETYYECAPKQQTCTDLKQQPQCFPPGIFIVLFFVL